MVTATASQKVRVPLHHLMVMGLACTNGWVLQSEAHDTAHLQPIVCIAVVQLWRAPTPHQPLQMVAHFSHHRGTVGSVGATHDPPSLLPSMAVASGMVAVVYIP
jgi:hypothetical protein